MKNAKPSRLVMPKEIEETTAKLWIKTGAIILTEEGSENSYYVNEFGHTFYCKNYPAGGRLLKEGVLK
jgi:hypothetical protein